METMNFGVMDIYEKVLIRPQYYDIRLPQFETAGYIPDVFDSLEHVSRGNTDYILGRIDSTRYILRSQIDPNFDERK